MPQRKPRGKPAPMDDKLLPCPFCGREPRQKMIHPDGDDREPPYLAACCEAHTDWITVEQWNRRPAIESVRSEALEELAKDADYAQECALEHGLRLVELKRLGSRI